MKYLLMIYSNESEEMRLDEAAMGALMKDYGIFTKDLMDAGAMVAADRLRPTADATTVRVRDGKPVVVDGPFAETKEQLGGYYLVDVPNLDEALKWAARIPSAAYGSVEVRPVWA